MNIIKRNLLKIGMIMFLLLLFLLPIRSFAWNGYHFYCYDDQMCQGVLGPGYSNHTQNAYGAGDIYKSIAGVWHSMNKNGSQWLGSEPFITDGYRYAEPEYTTGSKWPHTNLETVDNVGAACVGHKAVGGGTGYRVSLVVDANENNKSEREQKLGYIAYMSTVNGETGRENNWKNLIRGWVWDNNESYGGRIQRVRNNDNNKDYYGDDNNRTYWNTDAGADTYAKTVINQKFDSNSPEEGENAKQTIEYSEQGHTFIGPYNLQAEFGTITRAVIYTREGKSYETTYCSKDGKNIEAISAASSYNGNNFYIVAKDIEVDSVEKIILYKTMNVIESRIVVAENATGNQHLSIFYGQRTDKESEMKLPGVPFSKIEIQKKDLDSGWGIENVGFIVYNETEKKWVYDGTPAKYVDSKEEAIEHMYRTNKNGEVTIRNLNKKGTYKIYEVSNPNFGYLEATIDEPSEERTVEVTAVGLTIREEIDNPRLYVKLSGYVWEDNIESTKKLGANNLYADRETDDKDKRIKNVTVTLKKADGTIIDTRVTNTITNTKEEQEEGAYLFGDYQRDPNAKKIEIEDLKGAYIEFEYNGMCYKSVPVNVGKDNGSKATDDNLRRKFNDDYSTITKGVAQNSGYQLKYDREYKKGSSTSSINYGGNYLYGYEGQAKPISGVDEQYLLIANTLDAAPDNLLGQAKYTIDTIYKEEIEEVPNINLGVKTRGMPDLSVVQDVEKAEISLNGYTHTYEYANRRKDFERQIAEFKAKYPEEEVFNVGVNFANKYESALKPYTRTIYASDVIYNKDTQRGKLEVYITYEIVLSNESSFTNTKINQLYNYFDQDYESITLKEQEREIKGDKQVITYEKDITNSIKDRSQYNNRMDRVLIEPEGGIQIKANKQKYLVLAYKLSDAAVIEVLNQDKTLDSVTEVASYSSYEDDNFSNPYAGIDTDSEPNNEEIGKRETYEDDIDQAPSLILKTDKNRSIKGTVWQEEAIQELLEAKDPENQEDYYKKQRIGNGQYDASQEKVIKDVKVELLRVNSEDNREQQIEPEVAKLYTNKEGEEGHPASMQTRENGEYEFEGVIPGQYILRFTYKNKSILYNLDGTPYKTLEDASAKEGDPEVKGGVEYYKSTLFRTTADKEGNIYDEAYRKAEEFMYWYADETKEAVRLSDAKDNQELAEYRTSIEKIDYEEATKDINKLEEISADSNKLEIKMDCNQDDLNNISEFGKQLKFEFDNLDFGIIRRPKQPLKLTKEISYVEVILANGQVVIKGDPREGPIEHLKFLPDNNVHIELDDEIIQGATLRIKYEIKVDNRECEIDYNDINYYYFGKIPTDYKNRDKWKIATITDLFDYPNNGLNFNPDNNTRWDYLDLETIEEGKGLALGLKEILKKYNVILHTDKFGSMLPGQEQIETMVLTRLLSNTNDELSFDNEVEVNTYDGRRIDYTIPGNYDPTEGAPSEDDNSGKNLVITGPTGENQEYLSYIALGVTAFILLGVGIVMIKKKVL